MRLYTCLLLLLPIWLPAQIPVTGVAGEWFFVPDYSLPRRAKTSALPVNPAPKIPLPAVYVPIPPLLLHGELPTERRTNLIALQKIPTRTFSVELWLLNHVNQPIGAMAVLRNRKNPLEYAWQLSYYDNRIIFGTEKTQLLDSLKEGWKEYWYHLVGTYDGKQLTLYVNGERKAIQPVSLSSVAAPEIELSAYVANEPYMQLADLVKAFRLYDYALPSTQIKQRFTDFQQLTEAGKLVPSQFHFNAGPYLHYATQTSINLTWETDRPAMATLMYGTKLPLTEKIRVNAGADNPEITKKEPFIQEATLSGLQPGTKYFYTLQATSATGETIESGIRTFSTAVPDSSAYTFALIGDTEARPHINNRVSQLVWDERPNFLVCVGDLTDGGKEPHKFQWNYEYFLGMNSLTSRIPMFPLPGNGEDDLYWYSRYHRLPEAENFYSFRYGNAEFFMLDSNPTDEFAPGGKQYIWLEKSLKQSKAAWKFVAFHFAPYSADEDDYGNSWEEPSDLGDLRVRKIVPLFDQYGVDMVFFGHLHTYNRSLPVKDGKVTEKGVIYLQSGGAGGNLEDFAPTRAWFSAKTFRGHHYCLIDVHNKQLTLKMYDLTGSMRDYLEMRK